MKYWIIPLFFIAFLIGCDKATDPVVEEITKSDVYITVLAKNNLPVKGANIFIVDSEFTAVSDEYGNAKIKDVPKGIHDIIVYSEGLGSGKGTFDIEVGKLNKITITLVEGVFLEPEIEIVEPNIYYPGIYAIGDSVKFSIYVEDNITPPESISVKISSDIDGVILNDFFDKSGHLYYATPALSKGEHTFTVTATDLDNYSRNVSFTIKNLLPSRPKLSEPEKVNGDLKLTWSKSTDVDFTKYKVFRGDAIYYYSQKTLLAEISNIDETTFLDETPPLVDSVFYQVASYNSEGDSSLSEKIFVKSPGGKLYDYAIKDVIIHPSSPYLYFSAGTELIMFDYEKEEVVAKREFLESINFLEIGDNGKGLELYVPDYNGMIRILDPISLDDIFVINTTLPVNSVVIDGKGNIYAAVRPSPWWEQPVRSYSRETGAQIDGSGDHELSRLRMHPSNFEIIEITTSVSPTDMEYYKLGDDGKFIEHVNDTYHGDYPLNAEIFRISPNGEYLLTSAGGAIYTANSSMTYLGALPRGSMRFSDFAFDETGTTIYAGMGTARKIQKFNYATLSIEEEFSTSGYPFIIFRRGEKIVVVSKTIPSTEYSSYYKIAIETVEI